MGNLFLEELVVGRLSEASGEGSGITDIVEPGGVENEGVEHEGEAGGFDCTVPTEIEVPFVLLLL